MQAAEENMAEETLEELPVGGALHRIMHAVMFKETPVAELDALPLAQLRLLWTVYHSADATMKDFSERLGVSQSTVTQLADRLVKRGLVDRLADPADRRVVRLRLSETGRRILNGAEFARQRTLHTIWNILAPEEQEAVMLGLQLLGDAAERVRAEERNLLQPGLDSQERSAQDAVGQGSASAAQEPVVNLLGRRVRGRSA